MRESFRLRNINITVDFPLFRCICYTVMKSDSDVGGYVSFISPIKSWLVQKLVVTFLTTDVKIMLLTGMLPILYASVTNVRI